MSYIPGAEIITNDFSFFNMELVLFEHDSNFFCEFWLRVMDNILSVKIPKLTWFQYI